MRVRCLLGALVVVALLASSPASARQSFTAHDRVGLIVRDNVLVHEKASTHSRVLAVLVEQTQVEVLARHSAWFHVRIWASVSGWVQSREIVFRKLYDSVSTYHAPEVHYQVQAHGVAPIDMRAATTATTALRRAPGGSAVGSLLAGKRIRISAWQQDSLGKVWYRTDGRWALGDTVQFASKRPEQFTTGKAPAWRILTGKGMWLTLGVIAGSSPDAIVAAAVHNGITHLYLEAAISPLSFHGRKTVGGLIEAAHRHHIAVIAWVYPYLYDLASDVDLTRQVASFHTSHGDSFDGIAADLERDVQLWNVRAYSQLVRTYLGERYLLVGVTYPPQSSPNYPFAEVAHDYDVIAPMDYWHETKTHFGLNYGQMRYGYAYSYRYAADSIQGIRRLAGSTPIAPIGQTFDDFGRLEMGPNAPSSSEVRGFLAGCKAQAAVGASFFQWMTTTDAEWHALADFRY